MGNHAAGIDQKYIEEKSDYLLSCEDQVKKGLNGLLEIGVVIFDGVKVIAKVLFSMKSEKLIQLTIIMIIII